MQIFWKFKGNAGMMTHVEMQTTEKHDKSQTVLITTVVAKRSCK